MARPPAACRVAVALMVATSLAAAPAQAAPAKVTPADAQAWRTPAQQSSQETIDSGNPLAAALALDAVAQRHGDPILFLDAADAYYLEAEAQQDLAPLDTGVERVNTALDILHFLRDPASSDGWKPVDSGETGSAIDRANTYLQRAVELRTQIESVDDAPPPAAAKSAKPGQTLMLAGGVAVGLGVAGLGVGGAGLAIGAVNQGKATDPTVYGDAYDEADRKGKTGNLLAIVGLSVGGVLTVAGVALLVLGLKKKKAAGPDATAHIQVFPTLGGLGARGRF